MKTTSTGNGMFVKGALDSFECPKDTTDGTGIMFKVKRNPMGELFIAMLRKALNRSSYTMRVRSSGCEPSRRSLRKRGIHVTDDSVPLEYATPFRVYIESVVKQDDPHVEYWKIQYEYMDKEHMKLYNKLTAIRKVLDARDEGKVI